MSIIISPDDGGNNLQLNERDTRKSIVQNIAILLKTKIRTVPMYREFGIDMGYLDKPINVATNLLAGELRDAIETWEPRVRFLGASFEQSKTEPGRLIPTVEVELRNE